MKAKWGSFLVDGRGKINGHVASKNRFGAYMRTKVTPVNPNTSYQSAVRSTFGNFASRWSNVLTQSQRDGWIQTAQNFPVTNIFGDVKFLSGFNFYLRTNAALQNAGQTTIDDAPAFLAPADVVAGALTLTSGGGGTGTLAFTTSAAGPAHKINLYSTINLSSGINFVKSELRYVGTYDSAVSPIDFAADWRTKFGAAGFVTGKKIFVAVQDLEVATGALGIPQIVSAIVP